MKNYQTNRAFTLLEIIIATCVVGVIMWGIVTSNISLQKSSKNFSDTYFVTLSTQTILNYMLQDAYLAVGTGTYPGIVIGVGPQGLLTAGTGDDNTTCMYQQDHGVPMYDIVNNGGVPSNGGNPPFWACYTLAASGDVYLCKTPFIINAPYYGAGFCGTGSLGKVKTLAPTFSISSGAGVPGAQKALFNVKIESCLDPAASSCCDPSLGGCVPNVNNPYVVKSGSVSPPAQSAG